MKNFTDTNDNTWNEFTCYDVICSVKSYNDFTCYDKTYNDKSYNLNKVIKLIKSVKNCKSQEKKK